MAEQRASTISGNPLGWAQDQLYQLKAQNAQLREQVNQLQGLVSDLTEQVRSLEAGLRATALNANQAPLLQDELNQAAALILQLQDAQAELRERVTALSRRREEETEREQDSWVDLARRTDQVEREVAGWRDRQAGVEEVGRRFQEGLSLVKTELQDAGRRLEAAETRAGRSLEGANRAEHTLTQVEAAILALQREDEAIAERARVAAEVAHRLESILNLNVNELQRLELLGERVELHRAERQRLEDRAARLEELFDELHTRADQSEHLQTRLTGQLLGHQARLDALQEQLAEQKQLVIEQLLKFSGTQERLRRRQIEELEQEIREMKKHAAGLAEQ
jgi:chromosome segregation ATPase